MFTFPGEWERGGMIRYLFGSFQNLHHFAKEIFSSNHSVPFTYNYFWPKTQLKYFFIFFARFFSSFFSLPLTRCPIKSAEWVIKRFECYVNHRNFISSWRFVGFVCDLMLRHRLNHRDLLHWAMVIRIGVNACWDLPVQFALMRALQLIPVLWYVEYDVDHLICDYFVFHHSPNLIQHSNPMAFHDPNFQ